MSRVGKMPIILPQGVSVRQEGSMVVVKGPKGELKRIFPPMVKIVIGDRELQVERAGGDRHARAMHGTARSLLANMVQGVSQGFQKVLEIVGVGYRAQVQGQKLVLTVGYSHPVEFLLPKGITAKVEKNTKLILEGVDKEILGDMASRIRSVRPPEPYQGKGIRYAGERIFRKQGKAAGAK